LPELENKERHISRELLKHILNFVIHYITQMLLRVWEMPPLAKDEKCRVRTSHNLYELLHCMLQVMMCGGEGRFSNSVFSHFDVVQPGV
jgi:hypothetical protein